jgi:glycosyltransferase involved in cell wall biosynthesis
MTVLIDISNIIPGKGGAGGGVWIYSLNLLRELDRMAPGSGIRFLCIKNKENKELSLDNIPVTDNPFKQSGILGRLFWMHGALPAYCLFKGVRVLHRVTPEMPLLCTARGVCTLHDLMFEHYLKNPTLFRYFSKGEQLKFRIFRQVTRLSVLTSSAVVVPSHAVREEVLRGHPRAARKVRVTHEAVADRGQELPPLTPGPGGLFRIIVVAGFYPHKGHHHVLRVCQEMIRKGFTQFIVTLRGNPAFPEYIDDVKRSIAASGLSEHVRMASFEKKHSLADIYRDQDCFLLMSEYEGFGLPVLEAQQFGLPVVCSDIPVFREILSDSAEYLDLNDPVASADRFIGLTGMPERRNEMRRMGLENVSRYSWKKMAGETLEVYRG